MFYILVTPYYSSLYVVFILLMVLSWLRVQADRPFWIPAFGGGVAAGCGALAKAVLLIAPAQTLLFLILTDRSIVQRRLWVVWGIFTLAMMATIAPWILRNYQVFGRPVPVATSGPLVLYSANNPRSNGLYSSLPDETHVTTPAEMLSHGQWCREQAFRFIRSRPRDFASLVWRKLLHTWGTETTFVELINFKGQTLGKWDPALRAVVLTGWATLVLAWATTAVRAMYHRMPPAPLEIATGLLVLSKIIVYSLYEGGARHHLPAVPLLILLTAAMLMPDSGIHHGTTPPRPSIKHPESDLLPVRG